MGGFFIPSLCVPDGHSPEDTPTISDSLDTNPEPDTHPDPYPKLSFQGNSPQRTHSGPTTPLGSNPNPKQGIQASACRGLVPKPYRPGTPEP